MDRPRSPTGRGKSRCPVTQKPSTSYVTPGTNKQAGVTADASDRQRHDSDQFTSICTDPLFPSEVLAVIVTVPDRFPVTSPPEDTVAVLVLELDQEKL